MPKKGSSGDEYEDAAYPFQASESTVEQFQCAIADGATEASFSDRWARLLVKGFCQGTKISELQPAWKDEISGMELPWYAQEKAEEGAFAALVGLTLTTGGSDGGGTWEAKAVGDSIFFHIRDKQLLNSFPLTKSEDFNNSPELISSNPAISQDPDSMFACQNGGFSSGDQFLMLTDAIGAWALRRHEDSADALEILSQIHCQTALEELVNRERLEKLQDGRPSMRNDDVTLLRIEVSR